MYLYNNNYGASELCMQDEGVYYLLSNNPFFDGIEAPDKKGYKYSWQLERNFKDSINTIKDFHCMDCDKIGIGSIR